jgi:hypothetical protein
MMAGPIAGGIVTGVLFQLLAYLAIYKIALVITESRKLALLTSILSVLIWQTVWGSLSGMETGLFSALSLWGLYYYYRSERLSDRFSYIAYVLFTLAFLSRPECALFIVAAGIRDLCVWLKSESREFTPWIYRFLIVAILTAPYFVFNYWSSGTIFPNTFSAKIRGRDLISSILNGDLKRVFLALVLNPYLYFQHFYQKAISINPILILATMAGLFKLMGSNTSLRSKNIMLGLIFLLYVPLIGVFVPVFSATYHHLRYITNLLPIMAFMGVLGLFWNKKIEIGRHSTKIMVISGFLIIIGLGLRYIFVYLPNLFIPIINELRLYPGTIRWERLVGIVTKVGYGTVLTGLILLSGYLLNTPKILTVFGGRGLRRILAGVIIAWGAFFTIKNADTYANNVRNINEADVEAARFLGEIGEEGDVAAVNDIGSFGYYSNMEIFDLWGLVNRDLSFDQMADDSLIFAYMNNNKRVDYLAVFPGRFPYLTGRIDVFKKVAVFASENNTILGEDSTVVYKAEWPDSTGKNHR